MLKFATKIAPEPGLIAQVWDAGFRHTEIWLGAHHLDDIDSILSLTNRYAMNYVAHFPNRGALTPTQLDACVQLYQGLGSEAMVIHPPMLKAYGDALLSRDPDLVLAVENGGLDLDGFWDWAEGNTWLNLDVEHLWLFSLEGAPFEVWLETLELFLKRYHQKLRHVHMPGCEPGQVEHRPTYCNPRMACELWRLLEEHAFQGLAISELNLEWQTPEHLQRDQALFQEWLEDPKGTLESVRQADASPVP